jgi:biopolymer transport protein ExbB/TolQ
MSSTAIIIMVFAIIMITRHKKDRQYFENRLSERSELYSSRPALPTDPHIEREVEDLRERVRVLERIVTDANSTDARNSRRISDEIEALRHREHS